jgi:hypothetical protein
MLKFVKQHGLEGVIAKRSDSVYEPGNRSGLWSKYRINQGQEFVVGGYTPGNPFDALIVGFARQRPDLRRQGARGIRSRYPSRGLCAHQGSEDLSAPIRELTRKKVRDAGVRV